MATTALVAKQKNETAPEVATDDAPQGGGSEEVITAADAMLDEIEAVLEEYEDGKPKVAYTLADAIREGGALAPQAFGTFYDQEGATCALSGAYEALAAKGIIPA